MLSDPAVQYVLANAHFRMAALLMNSYMFLSLRCACFRMKLRWMAAQAATQETLKRLSLETLMAVLQSDNLRVPSEMHVFHSVLTWLEADPARKLVAAQVCGEFVPLSTLN